MGSLGTDREAKASFPNSATSMPILTSNLVVQNIKEWTAQFLQVKYILAGIKGFEQLR